MSLPAFPKQPTTRRRLPKRLTPRMSKPRFAALKRSGCQRTRRSSNAHGISALIYRRRRPPKNALDRRGTAFRKLFWPKPRFWIFCALDNLRFAAPSGDVLLTERHSPSAPRPAPLAQRHGLAYV